MKYKINNHNKIYIIAVICIVCILSNMIFASFAKATVSKEPEENQFLELRAAELIEKEGEKPQLIMELWGNNLQLKGFNVRFSYDTANIKLSSLQDNQIITDMVDIMGDTNEYFEFVGEFKQALDFMQISSEEGILDITISLNPPVEESENIVDLGEGIGKVLDTGESLLIGRISFQLTEEKFNTEWFKLVESETSSPLTGIKINIDGTNMFDNQSTFRFTDALAGGIKGQIYTAPTAKLNKYTATIKAYPSDKVKEIIDWDEVGENTGDDIHDKLISLSEKRVKTNDDGTYEMSLPMGTYDILVDKPGYLDQIYIGIQIKPGETVDLGYAELFAGDVNKDGIVEILDASLLMNSFGIVDTDSTYDAKYDFNEDKEIEILDASLLMSNYSLERKIIRGKE